MLDKNPYANLNSITSISIMDDDDTDAPTLLQSVLALFAVKRPQKSAKPASLRSQKRQAWLRADSFLQHDDVREADPASVKRTLRAFEHYVQDDPHGEMNFVRTSAC
jgi:hypothetical protein